MLLGSLAVPLIKNVFGRLTGRRDVRTGEYILRTDKDFSCYLILLLIRNIKIISKWSRFDRLYSIDNLIKEMKDGSYVVHFDKN